MDTVYGDTIYIPNTIVQNPKTYLNGQFYPIGNLKSYSISIFSRRGNRVFYCDEPKCFWDGKDSKGMLVPSGGYFYVIVGITKLGESKTFTGALNVLY